MKGTLKMRMPRVGFVLLQHAVFAEDDIVSNDVHAAMQSVKTKKIVPVCGQVLNSSYTLTLRPSESYRGGHSFLPQITCLGCLARTDDGISERER